MPRQYFHLVSRYLIGLGLSMPSVSQNHYSEEEEVWDFLSEELKVLSVFISLWRTVAVFLIRWIASL